MLARARAMTGELAGVALVLSEASRLPFRDAAFDVVTCSHAFYELHGDEAELALREVGRTLASGGRFVMMEHEIPSNPFVHLLFRVRLLSMGLRRAA
jgi:demethylmenaquinone methyltransferase/2-methoxy-6-polyprenyl-1,4-benzoquinol methylase